MKINVRLFLLLLLMIAGCSSGGEKNKKQPLDQNPQLVGTLTIEGSQAINPIMNTWLNEFSRFYPKVTGIVNQAPVGTALKKLLDDRIDMVISTRPLTQEERNKGLWSAPVAMDALVPVINFENAFIQPLVMNGLSKEELRDIFTGKIKYWSQVTGKKSSEKIKVFYTPDSSENSMVWCSFLGIQPSELKGICVASESLLVDSVINSASAIGFCSILQAYNFRTDKRKDGLYILPVDHNNNGIVDDDEHYYDKYSQICEVILSGKMPVPPAREWFIITKTIPQSPLLKAFVKWLLTTGQNFLPENGNIHIPKTKSDEVLKTLS